MESVLFLTGSTVLILLLGGVFFMLFRQMYLWSKEENRAEAAMDAIMNDEYVEDSEDNASEDEQGKFKTKDTVKLLMKTLTKIGCQPEVLKDKSLKVYYQGEAFQMRIGGCYVQIWDWSWTGVKANDPGFSNIQKAINMTNYNFGPHVVMSEPNDNGTVEIHSQYGIVMEKGLPNLEGYIKTTLDMFFDTKHELSKNVSILRAQQAKMNEDRRPIGFQPEDKSKS